MALTNMTWCRHYDDKVAEVQQGFWNCPCVPMRERWVCLNLPHLAVPVYGAFCSVNVIIFSKNIATYIQFDIVHTNSAHINGGL
jgi:hypothetical protein